MGSVNGSVEQGSAIPPPWAGIGLWSVGKQAAQWEVSSG